MGKKKTAKKVAVRVAKASKVRSKRRGVNKSQAIRDYMKDNPDDGPKAVCEALAKRGIKVTPPQVSNVKSTSAKRGGVKILRRTRGGGRGAVNGQVSVAALMEASAFVEKVGGIQVAKELIATLEKINR